MGELDKLFKDKLQNRAFEFKDAYWEDAERLIQQDEEDRRRRGGWWWKFGALFLVLAIAGFFFMNRHSSTNLAGTDSNDSIIQDVANPNPIIQTTDNQVSNAQQLISNTPTSNTATQIMNIENRNLNSEQQVINPNFRTPETEVLSYEKNAPNSKTIQKGTTGSNRQDNLKEIKALDVEELDIQLPNSDSVATERKEIAIQTDLEPIFTDQDLEIVKDENADLGELTLLETVASEIEIPDTDCDGCFDFGKIKQRPFSLGIVAEGIAYPVKKGETNWIGASIGLTAKYKFNRHISLNSGVQYSMIQGNGGRVLDSRDNNGSFAANLQRAEYDYFEDNQYSFGLRNVEAIFPPKTFHSLDIPLTLQLTKKHSSFEIGFQWNLLLGIRGSQVTSYSLFPWEQESLGASSSFEINEVKSKDWLPEDNYRKILTRVTLGYRYAFNPRFSVGANAYYRTQKLNNKYSDTSAISESSGPDSFTPKRLHVRLGTTYYF